MQGAEVHRYPRKWADVKAEKFGYTIVNWAPACGARFDSARLLRQHGVQMVRPYVCTKEAGHEGMHWDEDAEALWGSDWTALNDGIESPEGRTQ